MMSRKSDPYYLTTSLIFVFKKAQLACITTEAELLQEVVPEIVVQ
jgi:hypothetical protein